MTLLKFMAVGTMELGAAGAVLNFLAADRLVFHTQGATMTRRHLIGFVALCSACLAALASAAEAAQPQSETTAAWNAYVQATEERIVMAGAANLVRADTDFPGTVRPVLEALEEQVVLLRLLTEMAEDSADVAVRIGHENPYAGLHTTSMVTTGYGAGSDLVAGLGVVGPTRMDYPTTMASVRRWSSATSVGSRVANHRKPRQ